MPAYKSILYYNKLRYRLLPYIYSLAGAAYHDNYTIMRGLAMDFAKDTAVLNIGRSIHVRLFITDQSCLRIQTTQAVKCICQNLQDGMISIQANGMKADKELLQMLLMKECLLFVKAGSIIPFGPELQYTSEKPADTITLNIYTGADASFNLYEDEGTNYNYEKGAFSIIPIKYNEATKTITIGDRKGSFNGMLQKRVFRINIITPGQAKRLDFDAKCDKEISYEGKKLADKNLVKLNI